MASILVMIAVTLTAVMDTSMPSLTGVSQMANSTMYNTFASFNAASLISILPIILIAVILIVIIVAAFSLFRASGAAE
jgi:hypothetical protein